MNELTVIDFFCGAGGFSEGFRQLGFKIVAGYDHWMPAVNTFNYNYNLDSEVTDVSKFYGSKNLIENLPNTDVIVGSPPCVSFSNSNKSGKADKSLGILLTESFLRVVAIKKHQPNSTLKAWFMENVENSIKHLPTKYTFAELKLTEWAKSNNLHPNKVAIRIDRNSAVLNSANYGSPQKRKRAFVGEIISKGKLEIPIQTHTLDEEHEGDLEPAKTLSVTLKFLPRPNSKKNYRKVNDPNYPIQISSSKLTDHFYDSGLYECQWKNSKYMKRNHPYMGRMAFPENRNKPSRTITATNIGTSREAIIYKSEYKRTGDGEYRVPTVREMACLMGFPITYQFLGGSESSKCRLVGNSVCPTISRALAKTVLQTLNIEVPAVSVAGLESFKEVPNLNTFKERVFDSPPKKNKGSRFRRHPFKVGNITVTLSNYDIIKGQSTSDWITSIQYGNGEGYPIENKEDNLYKELIKVISKFDEGEKFLSIINNGFTEKIANKEALQEMYENQSSRGGYVEPTVLIEQLADIINEFQFREPLFVQNGTRWFTYKDVIPKKQIMALYAINKISTLTNSMGND